MNKFITPCSWCRYLDTNKGICDICPAMPTSKEELKRRKEAMKRDLYDPIVKELLLLTNIIMEDLHE